METAMVGRFGLIGLSAVLGSEAAIQRAIVFLPGKALQISARELQRIMLNTPSIREHMLRYVSVLLTMNAQVALCSTKHETQQRVARWMLLARDRVDLDRLSITQGSLASILGVTRWSVSAALRQFESQNLIKITRGALNIVNYKGLEAKSCQCHKIIDERFASLRRMPHHSHHLGIG